MGTLRLLLALSVVMSHVGGYAMIGGDFAVQCFYIISGFYMGLILNERYDRPSLNGAFFANRALRIYGLYYAVLAIYLSFFILSEWLTGSSPLWIYRQPTLNLPGRLLLALSNVTVLGLDFTFWLKIVNAHLMFTTNALNSAGLTVFHFTIIPPAWSLAIEMEFYLVAPFIARRPSWQISAMASVLLAVRGIAAYYGWEHDPLTYRFFPFELALFLGGVLAYRAWRHWQSWWGGVGGQTLAVLPFIAIAFFPIWHPNETSNTFFESGRLIVLSVLLMGLPGIHQASAKLRWDRAVGELSFPVYLLHFLIIGLFGPQHKIAVVVVSIAAAGLLTRFVDLRIEQVRSRLARRAGARAIEI